MVIVFEGIDGSGKDTVISKLFHKLGNERCLVVDSISQSLLGKAIRKVLHNDSTYNVPNVILATAFLQEIKSASKAIEYKLKEDRDKVILVNRWIYSTLAYNTIVEKEMDKELFDYIRSLTVDILVPNHVVYLDLDINVAIERISKRSGKDFEKFEDSEQLSKIKETYSLFFNPYKQVYDIECPYSYIRTDMGDSPDDIVEDLILSLKL